MEATYVYVAGYSRSGSTLLDILLGSHPAMVGTGELTYLFDDYTKPERACTCGAPYAQCQLWGGLVVHGEAQAGEAVLRRIESRGRLRALIADRVAPADAEAYGALNVRLLGHIRRVSGKTVIIDSSKNARDAAGRALAVQRFAGERVYMIHLVRSLASTVASYLDRGSNWRLEGRAAPRRLLGWRAIMGWSLAHRIAADLGSRLGPGRYLRLDYETLAADPLGALATIERFLGCDLAPLVERVRAGEEFAAGHNVGGNRMRLAPVRIVPRMPVPVRLPWPYRAIVPLVELLSCVRRTPASVATRAPGTT